MTVPPSYLVGLIGAGITHSLTPAMHEHEAAALGLRYEYRLLELERRDDAPDAIGGILAECRAAGFAAVNITYPWKQLVLPHLDELDDAAARIGAANLVIFRDHGAVGFNVDGTGFAAGLRDGLPGATLDSVVQFGGGGAGSATADALLELGVHRLTLVDLDPGRLELLVGRLRAAHPGHDVATRSPEEIGDVLASADGVVNATPIGMSGHPGSPVDVGRLPSSAWVADVVYRPLTTELVASARSRGLRTLDGGRMAVGQALASFHLITGLRPDAARMRAHFLELVRAGF
jgi:shikimate dehydrogenase